MTAFVPFIIIIFAILTFYVMLQLSTKVVKLLLSGNELS